MTEEIKFDEETEVRNFPKIDRSRLYAILLLIFIGIVIIISIKFGQIWIFFIIIPLLILLKREKAQ